MIAIRTAGGVIALACLVAACSGRAAELKAGTPTYGAQSIAGSSSPSAESPEWFADLDVVYDEWLRIPGSGAVPVQRTLTYHLADTVAAGPATAVVPSTSELTWTIECQLLFLGVEPDPDALTYVGRTSIDPDPAPSVMDGADVAPDESLLPALAVTAVRDEAWVLHQLPDVVPFGRALECPDRDTVHTALRPMLSRAGLMDPDNGWYGRPGAAPPGEEGDYVVRGGEGFGWRIGSTPDASATEIPIDFRYELIDSEFGIRFTVTGAVTRIGP